MKFDKNIPIPPAPRRGPKQLFGAMKVGDSLFRAGKKPSEMHGLTTNAKKKGFKFTAREVVENGIKGSRIWRIS